MNKKNTSYIITAVLLLLIGTGLTIWASIIAHGTGGSSPADAMFFGAQENKSMFMLVIGVVLILSSLIGLYKYFKKESSAK